MLTSLQRLVVNPLLTFLVPLSMPTLAADEPVELQPDRVIEYKRIDDIALTLHVFQPERELPGEPRPGIVLFHGGGWNNGSPASLYRQCEYLRGRGMVAISAAYRLREAHGATPFEAVKDAVSAMRWVRQRTAELGIDPDRLAAGGGSAGGHLAAATAALSAEWIDEDTDHAAGFRPDALILFNPVYDNGPDGYGHERIGDRYTEFSPMHNLHAGMPPTLVMFGDRDKHVPVPTAQGFQQKMRDLGCRSELIVYPGQEHAFYNKVPEMTRQTLADTDAFLVSLGWLAARE